MPDEPTITRDGARIAIVGNVRGRAACDQLRETVIEAIEQLACEKPEITINVADADYIDSLLLSTLVTISRKCLDFGLTLVLEDVNDDLAEVLRVTHIDEVLRHRGARVKRRPAA